MRYCFLAVFCVGCISALSQAIQGARMFRGNPAHNEQPATAGDFVIDTREWHFYAGAPVRSTPLTDGNFVYFGTTAGQFYCIDKSNTKVRWQVEMGAAVNSSAASVGEKLFFTDNRQSLYCFNKITGKKIWEQRLGTKLDYPWRFDYYYSSPVIYRGQLIVGSDDGQVYNISQQSGKINWTFKTKGIVRSTAAVHNGTIFIGDTEGYLYAIDEKNGKEQWSYQLKGASMNLEQFGFDRKAILAAPVVYENRILVGARDGFLYCLGLDGRENWIVDHQVSWVISTVAVKDSFVVTGTSDGRFVQCVNLFTGAEVWKFRPNTLVWSSPLIVGKHVYAGGFDGVLYCIDLRTGKRVSLFSTNGKIMSSPVFDGGKIYVGSDDGNLYCLKGHEDRRVMAEGLQRFVFHDPAARVYFHNGGDIRVKNYLANAGFKVIGADTLERVMSPATARNKVIVMASSYLPNQVLDNGPNSITRQFLDAGGRIVMPGTNTMIFAMDEKTKQPFAFNIPRADSVLGIYYGPNDTRGMGGQFTCFASERGMQFGLPAFWDASLFLKKEQVDVVLGVNENGLVSAFVRNYQNGGRFVQLFLHPELPQNLDALVKLAEWKLE